MGDWPPVSHGTKVITTEANPEIDDWTKEALLSRQWGVEGTVIMHHDSHGLCYDVSHEDGTVGCYDPTEFQVGAMRCAADCLAFYYWSLVFSVYCHQLGGSSLVDLRF